MWGEMIKTKFLPKLLWIALFAFGATPSFAANDLGINTSGESALPLGAGGTQSVWVQTPTQSGATTGNVGIGVPVPAANLDVVRGLKIGIDEEITTPPTGYSWPNCTQRKVGTLSQTSAADGNLYLCSYDATTGKNIWKTLGKSTSVYGLQAKTMVPYGSWVVSNILQYNAAGSATVSVTAPGYLRINGGAWVQTATVSTGQTVQLGVTAPFANLASVSVTLTTGSEQDTWKVTTASQTNIYAYINWGGWLIACQIGSNCDNAEHHGHFENENNCNGSGQNVYLKTWAGTNTYSYKYKNDCEEWYGSYTGDTNATSWTNGWNISVAMGVL